MSIEDQMHIIGIVLGWIIFGGYLWSVMNYFVKLINRKVIVKLPQDSPSRKKFSGFMHAVIRSHVYVPLFLLTIILLHFLTALIHVGFFITGIITISLMTLQIALGIYGTYVKNKSKGPWLYAHRTIASLLSVAIIAHVITVIILNP